MVRMTKKEKRLLELCREIWPDAARLEGSREIKIVKKEGTFGASFGEEVMKYLENNATMKNEKQYNERSPTGFVNSGGILGGLERTYLVNNSKGEAQGKINYTEIQSPFITYAASIRLIGFDKKSTDYRRLIRNLKTFAEVEPDSPEWFGITYLGFNKRNPRSQAYKKVIQGMVERARERTKEK